MSMELQALTLHRSWPTLAKPTLAKPALAKPSLTHCVLCVWCGVVLCLCVCVFVCCVCGVCVVWRGCWFHGFMVWGFTCRCWFQGFGLVMFGTTKMDWTKMDWPTVCARGQMNKLCTHQFHAFTMGNSTQQSVMRIHESSPYHFVNQKQHEKKARLSPKKFDLKKFNDAAKSTRCQDTRCQQISKRSQQTRRLKLSKFTTRSSLMQTVTD